MLIEELESPQSQPKTKVSNSGNGDDKKKKKKKRSVKKVKYGSSNTANTANDMTNDMTNNNKKTNKTSSTHKRDKDTPIAPPTRTKSQKSSSTAPPSSQKTLDTTQDTASQPKALSWNSFHDMAKPDDDTTIITTKRNKSDHQKKSTFLGRLLQHKKNRSNKQQQQRRPTSSSPGPIVKPAVPVSPMSPMSPGTISTTTTPQKRTKRERRLEQKVEEMANELKQVKELLKVMTQDICLKEHERSRHRSRERSDEAERQLRRSLSTARRPRSTSRRSRRPSAGPNTPTTSGRTSLRRSRSYSNQVPSEASRPAASGELNAHYFSFLEDNNSKHNSNNRRHVYSPTSMIRRSDRDVPPDWNPVPPRKLPERSASSSSFFSPKHRHKSAFVPVDITSPHDSFLQFDAVEWKLATPQAAAVTPSNRTTRLALEEDTTMHEETPNLEKDSRVPILNIDGMQDNPLDLQDDDDITASTAGHPKPPKAIYVSCIENESLAEDDVTLPRTLRRSRSSKKKKSKKPKVPLESMEEDVEEKPSSRRIRYLSKSGSHECL